MDQASQVLALKSTGSSREQALASGVCCTTHQHHARGRRFREENDQGQQSLYPWEQKALVYDAVRIATRSVSFRRSVDPPPKNIVFGIASIPARHSSHPLINKRSKVTPSSRLLLLFSSPHNRPLEATREMALEWIISTPGSIASPTVCDADQRSYLRLANV